MATVFESTDLKWGNKQKAQLNNLIDRMKKIGHKREHGDLVTLRRLRSSQKLGWIVRASETYIYMLGDTNSEHRKNLELLRGLFVYEPSKSLQEIEEEIRSHFKM